MQVDSSNVSLQQRSFSGTGSIVGNKAHVLAISHRQACRGDNQERRILRNGY